MQRQGMPSAYGTSPLYGAEAARIRSGSQEAGKGSKAKGSSAARGTGASAAAGMEPGRRLPRRRSCGTGCQRHLLGRSCTTCAQRHCDGERQLASNRAYMSNLPVELVSGLLSWQHASSACPLLRLGCGLLVLYVCNAGGRVQDPAQRSTAAAAHRQLSVIPGGRRRVACRKPRLQNASRIPRPAAPAAPWGAAPAATWPAASSAPRPGRPGVQPSLRRSLTDPPCCC